MLSPIARIKSREKVVYQIYVQSFKDSNGDGIGDIKGIKEKIPYLNNLGIDIIWLTPIFCSPFKDNGYDISDYFNINPIYGTKSDLKELIQEAKRYNIEIMLDLVLNHCSTEHEWFKKAKSYDEEYRKYFKIFEEKTIDRHSISSKFGGSAWEPFDGEGGEKLYYLHLFSKEQADLNWDNSKLRKEVFRIVNYWIDFGIKHYRLDVINLISKRDFLKDSPHKDKAMYTDGPNSHKYISELSKNTFGNIEGSFSVGELSSSTIREAAEYSNIEKGQLSSVFSFNYLKFDFKNNERWAWEKPSVKKFVSIIKEWQEGIQQRNGWLGIALNNHDQPRFYSRFFGHEEKHWNMQHKLLAILLFTLRGTPFIFQGDEYGEINPHFKKYEDYRDIESLNYYNEMIKTKTKKEVIKDLERFSRDNGRTTMRWNQSDENFGFSQATPWIPTSKRKLPLYLLEQIKNPSSIFNFYKYMIKLWKANLILKRGEISFFETNHKEVISFTRSYDSLKWSLYLNFSNKNTSINVSKEDKIILTNYITGILSKNVLTLRPYEGVIIRNG